uniref:MSP domain-containing protein n=1 Tax=Leersia perrieri TaxID=77586 RepID=A0A0D9WFU6_9ORYZ
MGSEVFALVEIHPRELRFEFEVKKKSSCSVNLVNKSEEYVAFKVKTTSPKRYCVRPNVGVIHPRETFIMQALNTAPPDLQIKDKFLLQTTAVPFGTADEDIAPSFFSKETGRYIEENKLRVVLVSATQPEEELLNAGVPGVEVPVAKETLNFVNKVPNVMIEVPHSLKTSFLPLTENPATLNETPFPVKQATCLPLSKEIPAISAESTHHWKGTLAVSVGSTILNPSNEVPAISAESAYHGKETPAVSIESNFLSTETNVALCECPSAPKESAILSNRLVNAGNFHHVAVQNLMSRLSNLEVKLEEAESVIIKLREETRTTIQERDKLQHEMLFLTRKGTSRSQGGFPLLFVVYMAILGVSLGYLLHV